MCLTPVTIKRRYGYHFYENNVPCGTCLECNKDKQNEYMIRSIEEQRKRGSMVFFTLTYSPEALPMADEFEIDEETGEMSVTGETQTLHRADVRKWKLSYEQYYRRKGTPLDYSFLICGEYGPKTLRPHYHGLIFGLSKEVVNDIMYRWKQQFGFVVFKFIPSVMSDVEKVSRYCAKYICKDENWNNLPSPFAEKPRKMTSKFYGMPTEQRWKKMVDYYTCQDICKFDIDDPQFASKKQSWFVLNEIIRRRKYSLGDGKQFKLPNYYRRKIFYKKDVLGKVVKSKIQGMVTYALQFKFNADFDEQLRQVAADRYNGDMAKAIKWYEDVQDSLKESRARTYEANNTKYMVRAVC